MLAITGPFPVNSSFILLPSPEETNTEGLRASVQSIRMMNGSLRTYVKPKNQRKVYRWEFKVAHTKAKELEDYIIANSGSVSMINWREQIYIGWLTLNPLEMTGDVSEYYRITLEFEEKK